MIISRLDKACNEYLDKVTDLSYNPQYDKIPTEAMDSLFDENDNRFIEALLVDEDELVDFLKSEDNFNIINKFFIEIQKYFKSPKIAKQLEKVLNDILNGKTTNSYHEDMIKYLVKQVQEANTFAENKE